MSSDENLVFCFNSGADRPYVVHLLVYLAQKVQSGKLDFVSCRAMGGCDSWAVGDDEDDDEVPPFSFILGDGKHMVLYDDSHLTVNVEAIPSHVTVQKVDGVAVLSKCVSIIGLKDADQMRKLLKESTDFVGAFLRECGMASELVTRYVFDPKHRILMNLGKLKPRSRKSLFLKNGETDRLFGVVKDFIDSRDEYMRCCVPYKLNVLLYGLPGSGKTSIITSIATEFKLDMVIIPFSSNLTDDGLANAFNRARQMGCRIVVLEDVDCLFEEGRKPQGTVKTGLTLSGLLNCMDGILRGSADGMIMFLTANLTDKIDEAMLRTSRVDLAMGFTHADEFQSRSCYEFYRSLFGWEQEDWALFWDGVGCFQFSTALLQQYFFQKRMASGSVLCVEEFKKSVRVAGKEGTLKPIDGLVYT